MATESTCEFYLADKRFSMEIGHKIETHQLIKKLQENGIEPTEYLYRTDQTDACVEIDDYHHITISQYKRMIVYELCIWNNLKTTMTCCGVVHSIDKVIQEYNKRTLRIVSKPIESQFILKF